jgi:hypothetical protein
MIVMKISFIKINIIFPMIMISSLFLGCNPNNPQPNGTASIKWNMTIDGINYSWQGTYPESSTSASGGSQYILQSGGPGQIILSNSGTGQGISVSISHSNMTGVGSSLFNQSNSSTNSFFSIMDGTNVMNSYSNEYGGSLSLNITTFPSNTVQENGISNSALVKGNFSGTLGKASGGTSTVSGSFESIRIQ